jgi:hypothetical protein
VSEEVLLDRVVHTDYGLLDLSWDEDFREDGDFDDCFTGQVNGLVGAAQPGGVFLMLARRSGGSGVRVVRHDAAPTDDPSWEDVVEVSTTIPDPGTFGWLTWAGEDGGELGPVDPGAYRVRVSARGRDAGADGEFADGVVDTYLVELWPAPLAADAIVRTTSGDAAYWHGEQGGNR